MVKSAIIFHRFVPGTLCLPANTTKATQIGTRARPGTGTQSMLDLIEILLVSVENYI